MASSVASGVLGDDDLRFAHRLADAADAVTAARFRALDLRVDTKPDLTPVSEADRRAEEVIRDLVGASGRGEGVLGEEFGDETVEFLCECADPTCSAALSIPLSVYEAVRDHARRFVIVPGHQREDAERVLEEHPNYMVVEKLGEAGEVAEDTDPRP